MITELGKFLRKLRIDDSEILLDMAKKLIMSPAYLSSIENGKRAVPTDFFNKINDAYELSKEQQLELQKIIDKNAKNVVIDFSELNGDADYIQTALLFARDFSHLNKTQLSDMKKILSTVGDNHPKGGMNSGPKKQSMDFSKS